MTAVMSVFSTMSVLSVFCRKCLYIFVINFSVILCVNILMFIHCQYQLKIIQSERKKTIRHKATNMLRLLKMLIIYLFTYLFINNYYL